MHETTIRAARLLAETVIREAGQICKAKFDDFAELRTKDEFGDVVTDVDLIAEEIIIKRIREAFPDHQIHSEEAGIVGSENDWLWMIDPLDGTNNFAIGLPVFSTSITLVYKREPVLGVIYEPLTDRLFVSVRGEGAFCNGRRMEVKPTANLSKGNIGWIQGHAVQHDPKAVALRQHIDVRFRRMLRLWAPTLIWCMLAKGNLDGIVLYNSEGDDLYSGLLMVKEAGGIVVDFDGNPFTGMKDEPYIIACHSDHKEQLLAVVRAGLGKE